MKKSIIVLFIVFSLPIFAFGAERVILSQMSEEVAVTVLESNDTHTILRFDIGGFRKEAVDIGGQEYYAIWCGKEGQLLNAGEPELPRVCRSIIIPDDAEMGIRVLQSEYKDFPSMRVIPSKGNLPRTVNPADIPYSFGSVYQTGQWYPEELASLREPYILRDWRGTVIELNAFRYHTGLEILRVYTSVTVEIYTTGPGQVNVLHRTQPLTRVNADFNMMYGRHFVNYGIFETRYTPVDEAGEMLIITYDSFHSTMQPFVDWKIQKGINTTIVDVSTVGNTSTNIRNYIQTFYNNTGGNLAWVLLVGDAAQVATPSGGQDPTYAKVAGGDNYPDIFIGRFSATTTAQVQTQVERSVEYERDAQEGADWYHMGTGIASDQGPGHYGEYDYQHMNLIRTDLLGFTYTSVDQIYDPGATASQVSTALNAGRSVVNYCGHGDVTYWGTTGFSNTNVNALQNDNKLPFIFSVACLNGAFVSATCFAEAWLRATHNGVPSGALATYMSAITQAWNPPMYAQDEAVDLLCARSKTTFGGICFNGSCKMIDICGSSGVTEFNSWHIFGDPSVLLRTDTPETMAVTHANAIYFDQTSFAVNVDGVSGALCALTHNGTLLGAEYTDGTGSATISVRETLPIGDSVKVTVTAFNKLTYIAQIPVITSVVPVENLCATFVDTSLVLSWSSTGAAVYNIYSDVDPFGGFSTFVAAVTDTTYALPPADTLLFFIVKSSDGN